MVGWIFGILVAGIIGAMIGGSVGGGKRADLDAQLLFQLALTQSEKQRADKATERYTAAETDMNYDDEGAYLFRCIICGNHWSNGGTCNLGTTTSCSFKWRGPCANNTFVSGKP